MQHYIKKNVIEGDIRQVKNVRIGDDFHYHSEKIVLPKELTTKIPKTSPEKIIGRVAEIDDLHTRLFEKKQVVLLKGLGGIGKTTLAQVYISKYWEEYRHIAWVSQTSDNFISDFITSEGLLYNFNIPKKEKNPTETFHNLINEFKKISDGPNLLILDNVDGSLIQWYDYLPGQPLWHILVTSRGRIEKLDIKDIDFLPLDEAINLFLSHYSHGKLNKNEIKEIVLLVDFHTLTIEILAKTAQLQRNEIEILIKAIEDDLRTNIYLEHKGEKIDRVTSYLCSIFDLSQLCDYELWVLAQLACLPSEYLSYAQLENIIVSAVNRKKNIIVKILKKVTEKIRFLNNQKYSRGNSRNDLTKIMFSESIDSLAEKGIDFYTVISE